jgi:hypothetical protein
MICIQNKTTRRQKTVRVTSTLQYSEECFFLCVTIGIPSVCRHKLPWLHRMHLQTPTSFIAGSNEELCTCTASWWPAMIPPTLCMDASSASVAIAPPEIILASMAPASQPVGCTSRIPSRELVHVCSVCMQLPVTCSLTLVTPPKAACSPETRHPPEQVCMLATTNSGSVIPFLLLDGVRPCHVGKEHTADNTPHCSVRSASRRAAKHRRCAAWRALVHSTASSTSGSAA